MSVLSQIQTVLNTSNSKIKLTVFKKRNLQISVFQHFWKLQSHCFLPYNTETLVFISFGELKKRIYSDVCFFFRFLFKIRNLNCKLKTSYGYLISLEPVEYKLKYRANMRKHCLVTFSMLFLLVLPKAQFPHNFHDFLIFAKY